MKSRQWGALLLILFFTFFFTACDNEATRSKKSPATLPSATVSVAQVTKTMAANQVELVGTIQAVEQAEIAAKMTGNIVALPVDLGSTVHQGDLLVQLAAGEISAQVQQAKAQLEQARRNLAREEKLLQKNAATPQMVKSLRDSTRIAEAAYKETQTMLGYSRLTAPFSGIITRKMANIGDLATPGKPLLAMEQTTKLQVLTDIPEAMILHIKKGDRLSVSVPSAQLTIEGVVAEVSPIADPSSRSAPIKLSIAPDPRLRSGQFARVALAMEQAQTLMVPRQAVQTIGQIESVFVVQDDKAHLRLVRTGASNDGHIEILSGLLADETIVTDGNRTLLDGQPIVVQYSLP